MISDRKLAVYEVEAVVKIKFKAAVSDAEKQLAKYPDVILEELENELGYSRTEIVSSEIRLIKENIPSLKEAMRVCNTHID
ncbi:hypothetical protein RB620_04495 [Paenibacillus sp. LHD-117]|uniref:hypothetical protein n=1 Tax=Paenibacillus sp. LHD-117 TaxID=3071412 RepID=UPI0027E17AA6|nr:hypothetical protein [Paenibacillus sp. LHD-117]MDQ6418692.1 hypothetical protein [Paenibacillus sp. LHD-117]